MNYEESVRYMSGLLQFGIRLDRERFAALLARVGDPHLPLRCVHVAGTNGKGSTTTFIASVLKAAGYKTGTYLSPYVFDLRERIQINGEMIPREDFARWVTALHPHIEVIAATDLGQTTEFELKTAVAFCWMAEQAVEFAVIEVGIGGRLDATNVIAPPLVSVITSIGLDHVAILGETLGKIAFEKAGIIKRGTLACITAVPPGGEALEVIEAKAREEGVPLVRVGQKDDAASQAHFEPVDRELRLYLPSGRILNDVRLSLRGPFQHANAACAAAAIETLCQHGEAIVSDAELKTGLEKATLPGRFQIVRSEGEKGRAVLVLDGAHNEDGARVLAEALRTEFGTDRRFRFVVGMRKNHEPFPHLRELASLSKSVTATAPPFKPAPAEEVADAARMLDMGPVTIIEPASEAIRQTWEQAAADEVVVVTGSFYTVGEARLLG